MAYIGAPVGPAPSNGFSMCRWLGRARSNNEKVFANFYHEIWGQFKMEITV